MSPIEQKKIQAEEVQKCLDAEKKRLQEEEQKRLVVEKKRTRNRYEDFYGTYTI